MVLYAVSRYIIEIYRGDDRGTILHFSTSQFVALLIVPVSLVMLWWLRSRTPATRPA
jgi:prolipoprotein diacylglyceryltransferase